MSKTVQFRRSTAVLTLVAASIGGGLVAALAVAMRPGAPPVPVTVTARADSKVSEMSNSFADMIEKASPAVVSITSTRVIKASDQQGGGGQGGDNPFGMDPFFRRFFGGPDGQGGKPRDQRERGSGSGVIVGKDGYVITNNHVVDKATNVRVTLFDNREFTAKVMGTDPQTDVAVLKINASGLPTLPLGNSDAARTGDLVFAIGNPFGKQFDHTVTMGIVSAKGRSLERNLFLQNFIQTDAAINPGNSGGALINAQGQMIGMNTAIISNGGGGFGGQGGNLGIGFAVPSNMAKSVMDQIVKTGKVTRGYMGVDLQGDFTPEVAQKLGVQSGAGALVAQVRPGTPGEKAGVKPGDVITAIDGQKVKDSDDLTMRVVQHAPGEVVHLDIIRDGKPTKVDLTLAQRPGGTDIDEQQNKGNNGNGNNDNGANPEGSSAFGISVEALSPEVKQQLGASAGTKGVVISDIDQGSPAADQPLTRGDIITAVDRQPVSSPSEFKRLAGQAQGKSILLTINRKGATAFVVVESK